MDRLSSSEEHWGVADGEMLALGSSRKKLSDTHAVVLALLFKTAL